jgi:hypothetical protein
MYVDGSYKLNNAASNVKFNVFFRSLCIKTELSRKCSF